MGMYTRMDLVQLRPLLFIHTLSGVCYKSTFSYDKWASFKLTAIRLDILFFSVMDIPLAK